MNNHNELTFYSATSAFKASGRFGRLSYLGWIFIINVFTILLFASLGLLWGSLYGANGVDVASERVGLSIGLLSLLIYLVLFYFSIVFIIRRFHDLNRTGWLSLLLIVPLVNIIMILYLLFARGSEGANNYGLPHQTKTWEKVCAWLGVIVLPLALVGVVAAIALPAYQDYVKQVQLQQAQITAIENDVMASEQELRMLEQQYQAEIQQQQAMQAASAAAAY